MPVVPFQAFERVECPLETLRHLGGVDPPEIARRRGREQVDAEVRR